MFKLYTMVERLNKYLANSGVLLDTEGYLRKGFLLTGIIGWLIYFSRLHLETN